MNMHYLCIYKDFVILDSFEITDLKDKRMKNLYVYKEVYYVIYYSNERSIIISTLSPWFSFALSFTATLHPH